MLALAEESGVSRAEVLSVAGLDESALRDEDAWLPQSVWRELWEQLVGRLDDPAIGLRAGRRIDRGYFGVIDYVVRSSATMGEALERAERYFRLANTYGLLEVRREGELVEVRRRILGDESFALPPQAAEFSLTAMVQLFRNAAAATWRLQGVTFRHAEPTYSDEHRRYFDCPVVFGGDADSLTVSVTTLDVPMREPDERLRALIERHADGLLEALPSQGGTIDDVRHVLAGELRGGNPSAENVADRLGISRRSLHRRLRREGTTFKALADGMRRAMAERYLRTTTMGSGEIAYLLGYAEASTFHRAFRSWTSMTPGAFRLAASE